EQRFGYARPAAAVQIVEVSLELRRPGPRLPGLPVRARTSRAARLEPARVFAGDRGRARTVPVFRREELGIDFHARGPALLLEYGATTFVREGFHARLDRRATLLLRRGTR